MPKCRKAGKYHHLLKRTCFGFFRALFIFKWIFFFIKPLWIFKSKVTLFKATSQVFLCKKIFVIKNRSKCTFFNWGLRRELIFFVCVWRARRVLFRTPKGKQGAALCPFLYIYIVTLYYIKLTLINRYMDFKTTYFYFFFLRLSIQCFNNVCFCLIHENNIFPYFRFLKLMNQSWKKN